MLEWIFLTAAAVGGTVMICQFAMTLLGVGHHGGDIGLHDGDVFGGDVHGDASSLGSGAHEAHAGHQGPADDRGETHHDGGWLFGVLSFRTLSAALAFFGLAGWAMLSAGRASPEALSVAVAAGLAAMYGIYALMRGLYTLQSDGTLRIESSLGQRGAVYIPIPGSRQGSGKIQLKVQGRLIELPAMTSHHERLPTGTLVEVVELVGPQTVLVELVVEPTAVPAAQNLRKSENEVSAGTDLGD